MTNEISFKEISQRSRVPLEELLETERTSTTKRKRRVAEFDWNLFRRAVSLNGPTDIVLTFADYLGIENREARRFEQLNADTIQFIEELERVSQFFESCLRLTLQPVQMGVQSGRVVVLDDCWSQPFPCDA